jgi:hypothetical protein
MDYKVSQVHGASLSLKGQPYKYLAQLQKKLWQKCHQYNKSVKIQRICHLHKHVSQTNAEIKVTKTVTPTKTSKNCH